jgi:hypothetical protein
MSYPTAKPDGKDTRELARILNLAMQGKVNVTLDASLSTSTTRTTLTDARISIDNQIRWSPKSSTAAAAMTALYVDSHTNGSAVLGHDSTTAVRSYRFSFIG